MSEKGGFSHCEGMDIQDRMRRMFVFAAIVTMNQTIETQRIVFTTTSTEEVVIQKKYDQR